MKNLVITILLSNLILLAGCVTTVSENGKTGSLSPIPMFLKNLPQDEDNYSQGFRDGCYNFVGQNGNGLLRMYEKSPRMTDGLYLDKLYRQGYADGDRYCGVFVNRDIIL